ncbi:MAG TPA: MerR family transcriptional regulator [Acidimicrobiales bacterium]
MAPSAPSDTEHLTIDELAAAAGTTVRRVRSLQTLGLLPHPELRGRTGVYGPLHQARLAAVLQLQDRGFSLESLGVLFAALDAGRSLAAVLGVAEPATATPAGQFETPTDTAELYGFADLEPAGAFGRRGRRPLLSLVPTTMWDESEAS